MKRLNKYSNTLTNKIPTGETSYEVNGEGSNLPLIILHLKASNKSSTNAPNRACPAEEKQYVNLPASSEQEICRQVGIHRQRDHLVLKF